MWDLRRRLHAKNSSRVHDWASLVVYCALPYDIDDQLEHTRSVSSKLRFKAAMQRADHEIAKLNRSDGAPPTDAVAACCERVEAALQDGDLANRAMPTTGLFDTEGLGMQASNAKKQAQRLFELAVAIDAPARSDDPSAMPPSDPTEPTTRADDLLRRSVDLLETARRGYGKAARQNVGETADLVKKQSLHWVMTQYLSLQAVFGATLSPDEWHAAKLSADYELQASSGIARAWALGTLVELHLLALGSATSDEADAAAHRRDAEAHLDELHRLAPPDSFEIESTLDQMTRYTDWWGHERFATFLGEMQTAQDPSWTRDWRQLTDCASALVAKLR